MFERPPFDLGPTAVSLFINLRKRALLSRSGSFAHRSLILIALNVHFLVIDVLRLQLLSIEYCGSLHLDNFCLLDDGRLSFHSLRGLVGQ